MEEDYDEYQPYEHCPSCGRDYDDIDFDFQSCSKCGYDANEKTVKPQIMREPSDEDYMNGDADIITGAWI